MRPLSRGVPVALLVLILPASGLRAGEDGIAFFEKKVRPVLVQHCYRCHSLHAKKQKGGLALDSRAGLLRGGESGPALVPGKPESSLLLAAVRYSREDLRMPPKGKLPANVVNDLAHWISLGAPDPRDAVAAVAGQRTIDLEKGRRFWAYQPPRRLALPHVKDRAWSRGPIDQLILARLEARGLRPGADADRATLLRRVTFDLVGLPPTPAEIDAFVRDGAPDALARVVDRLLASPHFGERWGRHWLDVARYADSSGGGRSLLFPNAFRYRDYVIEAFNHDVPYDRFVREQIAGDLLPAASPQERSRQRIATALLALGPTNYELQDKAVLEMDVIDEQLDTLGRAFLGQTLGCARCHDHKFDPIPTRDYYALAGILHSTQTLIHDNVSRWVDVPLPVSAAAEAALKEHEAAVAALREKIRQARSRAAEPRRTKGVSRGGAEVKQLEAELKQLLAHGPVRPVAMGVKEAGRITNAFICIRGNLHNRGSSVPRGGLQVLSTAHGPGRFPSIPPGASGRLQLAQWLASRDNPLTARVLVNRVWHHLFGCGLVRTVDVFGTTGEAPSHPELLDYLAVRFMEEGWSIKKLIRQIVLARVYGLDSTADVRAQALDPENRLLGHHNRRRLDAEALRDALLAISGQLDRRVGGPTMRKGTTTEVGYRFDDTRRSVYAPIFRNRLPEMLEVFDFADPNRVVGSRTISTVAPQALFLMNSPFVMEQARLAARRTLAEPGLDDATRLERACRLALGRGPMAGEQGLARRVLAGEERLAAWERIYHALFACMDFRYVR